MERYEDTIMRELEGETPKEKYESLKELKKKRITQVVYNDVVQAIMNNAQREILDKVLEKQCEMYSTFRHQVVKVEDIEAIKESLK